jgi:hypothetical protein
MNYHYKTEVGVMDKEHVAMARKARLELKHGLHAKLKESLSSVLPITVIVLLLHFTIAPMTHGNLAAFIVGSVLLILGMGLFTLGADHSMMPMGEAVGAELIKTRKLAPLIIVPLIIGLFITIAEPDLQVLAEQVPAIPSMTLIIAVAIGVGLFLVIALLRILFQIKLSHVLIALYALTFGIAFFAPKEMLAVALDSGGVTTGPITVPFILALGIGISFARSDKNARDDSFGLVAICSIGPILAVLILNIIYSDFGLIAEELPPPLIDSVRALFVTFGHAFAEYAKDVAVALLPIVAFFAVFQIFILKLPRHRIIKLVVGISYTYIGLALFLVGVNVGFLPTGAGIGDIIGALPYRWILIPIGALMGFFVVMAEPAVHVLNKQVEEITVGAVSKRAMLFSLAIGVAVSIALAMTRVLTGISIWWFILPGYAIALALSFFVPKIFTAIAFDSGGVASGPMTAAFLLPFAMGATSASGGDIMTDAFGFIAMVAMTPLIAIQMLGLVYKAKLKRDAEEATPEAIPELPEVDDDIINF